MGSEGKKTFKQYLKSEQTNRRTDGHTEIFTYRKHWPRGPMLKKYMQDYIILFHGPKDLTVMGADSVKNMYICMILANSAISNKFQQKN